MIIKGRRRGSEETVFLEGHLSCQRETLCVCVSRVLSRGLCFVLAWIVEFLFFYYACKDF